VGKGDSVLFWADMWNGRNLHHSFPHLYSFAVNTKITIKAAAEAKIFQDLFQTPLSVEAFEEYCKLEIIMQSSYQRRMIGGNTFGVMDLSLQPKLTNISLAPVKPIQLTNGFGSLNVR
jgi:hypothetical protein